jgi:hypothetical protein
MPEDIFVYKGFTVDFAHAQFQLPLPPVRVGTHRLGAALVFPFESSLGEELLSEMIRNVQPDTPYATALNRHLYRTLVIG